MGTSRGVVTSRGVHVVTSRDKIFEGDVSVLWAGPFFRDIIGI